MFTLLADRQQLEKAVAVHVVMTKQEVATKTSQVSRRLLYVFPQRRFGMFWMPSMLIYEEASVGCAGVAGCGWGALLI